MRYVTGMYSFINVDNVSLKKKSVLGTWRRGVLAGERRIEQECTGSRMDAFTSEDVLHHRNLRMIEY